jgi:hypothetical protein
VLGIGIGIGVAIAIAIVPLLFDTDTDSDPDSDADTDGWLFTAIFGAETVQGIIRGEPHTVFVPGAPAFPPAWTNGQRKRRVDSAWMLVFAYRLLNRRITNIEFRSANLISAVRYSLFDVSNIFGLDCNLHGWPARTPALPGGNPLYPASSRIRLYVLINPLVEQSCAVTV